MLPDVIPASVVRAAIEEEIKRSPAFQQMKQEERNRMLNAFRMAVQVGPAIKIGEITEATSPE